MTSISRVDGFLGECVQGQDGGLFFLGGDDADKIFGEFYPLADVLERESKQVDCDQNYQAGVKDGENDKIIHYFV